jgi:hypothetical protein
VVCWSSHGELQSSAFGFVSGVVSHVSRSYRRTRGAARSQRSQRRSVARSTKARSVLMEKSNDERLHYVLLPNRRLYRHLICYRLTHHAGQRRTRRCKFSRPSGISVLHSRTSVDGRHCPCPFLQAAAGAIRRNEPGRTSSRLPDCRGARPRTWVRAPGPVVQHRLAVLVACF